MLFFIFILLFLQEGVTIRKSEPLKEMHISVEVTPNVSMVGLSTSDNLSSSRSYGIQCLATGSNQRVTFSWFVNTDIYNGVERLTVNNTGDVLAYSSTILYHPKIGDKSISCLTYGRINQSAVAASKKLPDINEEVVKPVQEVAWYGKHVTFSCHPRLEITSLIDWEYPRDSTARVTDDNRNLNIESVGMEDEGDYNCLREGDHIEVKRLEIVYPELSNITSNNEQQPSGVTVFWTNMLYRLECAASAVGPPANLSWLLGNQELRSKTSTTNNSYIPEIYDYSSTIFYVPSEGDHDITCLLKTTLYSLNKSIAISVKVAAVDNDSRIVEHGGNISLSCDLQSNQNHLWKFSKTNGSSGSLIPDELIKTSRNNGNNQSHVTINKVKMKNHGYYSCFQLDQPANVTFVYVNVVPELEMEVNDEPAASDSQTMHRYRSYKLRCTVKGTFYPVSISWSVNGVTVRERIEHMEPTESYNDNELRDVSSLFTYNPNRGDQNVSCRSNSSDVSNNNMKVLIIKEIISVTAKVTVRRIQWNKDAELLCSYDNTSADLKWKFNTENETESYEIKNCLLNKERPTRFHQCTLELPEVKFINQGQYTCYHGLEEIEVVHLKVIVQLDVFILHGDVPIKNGPLDVYESSQYTFVCIANSTDEIKYINWKIDNIIQKDNITIQNETTKYLYQLRSNISYKPSLHHQTLSCSSGGEEERTKEKTVLLRVSIPFIRNVVLWSVLIFIIVTLSSLLVWSCQGCSNLARNNKANLTSLQMMEILVARGKEEGIDRKAWRRSMVAYSKSSASRFSMRRMSRRSRKSRTLSGKSEEMDDQYEAVIAESYGSRVIPFKHLCLAMKLKEGRYFDRWVGTMRQKFAAKTGVIITTVSGAVSEEKQFRWDMFVKNIIDIPRCQYIALIYGTGLSDGNLYLVQEFLAVESLRSFLEALSPQQSKRTTENILTFSLDIVNGISFLAKFNFCHPGIAIKKIMVTTENRCKLFDFCLKEDAVDKIEAIISKNKPALRNFASETILREDYSDESDVWSVGVALWELFSLGDKPFKGLDIDAIQRLMTQRFLFPQPANCHQLLYDVIVDCWRVVDERPTMDELLANLKSAIHELLLATSSEGSAISEKMMLNIRDTYGISNASSEETIYETMGKS
ncbi:uncharacterized protein [Apostichopus japonicus]|uniref:uncharacterized protein isoform X2 n=1 Tax=Stichopus japonicus TaxID=307972 RepID=UPI003AB530C1